MMTGLQEKLEDARATFVALTTPPLTIFELFDAVKAVGEIVREVEPAATEAEYEALLREAWAWADAEFQLVRRADDALKFPIYLAPAEAFDGPAIRYIVERWAIPALAARLASAVG